MAKTSAPSTGHFQCNAGTVFTDSDHDITHALHGANLRRPDQAVVQDVEEFGHIAKGVVQGNGRHADHSGFPPIHNDTMFGQVVKQGFAMAVGDHATAGNPGCRV